MTHRAGAKLAARLMCCGAALAGAEACDDPRPAPSSENLLVEIIAPPAESSGKGDRCDEVVRRIQAQTSEIRERVRSNRSNLAIRLLSAVADDAERLGCQAAISRLWIAEIRFYADQRWREAVDRGLDLAEAFERRWPGNAEVRQLTEDLTRRSGENIQDFVAAYSHPGSTVSVEPSNLRRIYNIRVVWDPPPGFREAVHRKDPVVLSPMINFVARVGEATSDSGFRSDRVLLSIASVGSFTVRTACARDVWKLISQGAKSRSRDIAVLARFLECAAE